MLGNKLLKIYDNGYEFSDIVEEIW
jgi:hypothetical protein